MDFIIQNMKHIFKFMFICKQALILIIYQNLLVQMMKMITKTEKN